MKISLIIPAYNEEKFIEDCLNHVINNSDNKFHEIIVVNNNSNDKTEELAKKYKEVKVVTESRKGLVYARERGLKEATGDLLAYIDADTHMPKGWIYNVVDKFNKDINLVCLSGPYEYYDIPRWQQISVKIFWSISAFTYKFVKYMVVGGNFVIKKDTLLKMNGFDTSISFYGEDTDIARRASEFGKVYFDLNFVMPTSGRRFAGQGFIKTFIIYVGNFFSEIFIKKPITEKYIDIR